jgi:thiol-disulfide isomerase/thioredoxin
VKPRARQWLFLAGTAAVALVLGYGVGHWYLRAPQALAPIAQPTLRLPDIHGAPHALSDWRGQVVLVNFWATWCPPCREEIPLLVDAQRRYGSRGFQVVGVALDDRDAVAAYGARMRINYPLLVGEDAVLTTMAELGNAGGALPYSVFLDPQGRPVVRKIGAFSATELDKEVRALLENPRPVD